MFVSAPAHLLVAPVQFSHVAEVMGETGSEVTAEAPQRQEGRGA